MGAGVPNGQAAKGADSRTYGGDHAIPTLIYPDFDRGSSEHSQPMGTVATKSGDFNHERSGLATVGFQCE